MKHVYAALLKAQKEISYAVKDAKNPHFKNNYATLESVIDAVKKPLNDNGLVIVHHTKDGHLITQLVHAETGELIESTCPLVTSKNDMQQLGSAQTYAKRYNLTALTNLPTEDDDGNLASQSKKQEPKEKPNVYIPSPSYDTIMFGWKELKGKRFSDVDAETLTKAITGTENYYQDKKIEIKGPLLDSLNNAKAYLEKLASMKKD